MIYSLGALYILEMQLLKSYAGINLDNQSVPTVRKSKLFMWSIEEVVSDNTLRNNIWIVPDGVIWIGDRLYEYSLNKNVTIIYITWVYTIC